MLKVIKGIQGQLSCCKEGREEGGKEGRKVGMEEKEGRKKGGKE